MLVMVDDRCGHYGLSLGRSDIFGAALEHPKQQPHAQIVMEFTVLTTLADHASALAQDHKCRPLGLLKHGQVACACDSSKH
uniref:Uncharacterized protein n=1 Tax=Hyaloperonospora arabidopsidis (strain Emoy2) TaxID=559515 RepID=M4BGA5_HYAAE